MTDEEQRKRAKQFAERWEGKGNEKQHCQSYWNDLVQNVFGVELVTEYLDFEKTVCVNDNTKFIDVYIKKLLC